MANPQTDNGYTRIANELLEALAHIRISGEPRQILDVIFRQTYGYQKKIDQISLSQFCLKTGLDKSNVCHAIQKLHKMNMIIAQKGNKNGNFYAIIKDFDTWKPLPKKTTIAHNHNKSLPKTPPTKEKITTKENSIADTANHQNIVELITKWREVNPAVEYGNKTERAACQWLIDDRGMDRARQLTNIAVNITRRDFEGKQYAPIITTPYELKQKWTKFCIFLKNLEKNNAYAS